MGSRKDVLRGEDEGDGAVVGRGRGRSDAGGSGVQIEDDGESNDAVADDAVGGDAGQRDGFLRRLDREDEERHPWGRLEALG